MIAQAVAGEVQAMFFAVQVSDILSKWVGEAEHNVNRLFATARQQRLSIIFIDEIEALAVSRRSSASSVMPRVVAQILTEMEGFHKGANPLLFIGATNEPWAIDPAMLRPGRFDEKIYVGLPDLQARLQLLHLTLDHRPLADGVELHELARLLEGYSGADIRGLCERVGATVFRESVHTGHERPIAMGDLLSALRETKPSVSAKELA
jgi:transitional endoplasmic reticulum ATPase